MADTNETGGEEIPMKGGGDTTDETGDQETSFGGEWDGGLLDQTEPSGPSSVDPTFEEFLDEPGFVEDSGEEFREDNIDRLKVMLEEYRIKNVIEALYKFRPDIEYGENNEKLLSALKTTYSSKTQKLSGLTIVDSRGKYTKLIVDYTSGRPRLSNDTRNGPSEKLKKEFAELIGNARREYNDNSSEAWMKRTVDDGAGTSGDGGDDSLISRGVVNEATRRTSDVLIDELYDIASRLKDTMKELSRGFAINDNVEREIKPVLDFAILKNPDMGTREKLKTIGLNVEHWKKLAEREVEPKTKEFYEDVAEFEELVKDHMRVKIGLLPEKLRTLEILKESIYISDMLRFQKFKRFAKKNLLGLSFGAISVAAAITGIVMSSRSTLRAGVEGIKRFSEAVTNVLEKMGSTISSLGKIVTTVLSWGAASIAWLANNLWVFAAIAAYVLYKKVRSTII